MLKSFYSSINEKSKGGQKEIFYVGNNHVIHMTSSSRDVMDDNLNLWRFCLYSLR